MKMRIKEGGFTLIETIIAGLLLAILMSMVYSAYLTAFVTYQSGSEITDAQLKAQMQLDRITEELWECDPEYIRASSYSERGFSRNQNLLVFLSARSEKGNFVSSGGKPVWQSVVAYCPYTYTDKMGRLRRELRRYEHWGVPAGYLSGGNLNPTISSTEILLPGGVTFKRDSGQVILSDLDDFALEVTHAKRSMTTKKKVKKTTNYGAYKFKTVPWGWREPTLSGFTPHSEGLRGQIHTIYDGYRWGGGYRGYDLSRIKNAPGTILLASKIYWAPMRYSNGSYYSESLWTIANREARSEIAEDDLIGTTEKTYVVGVWDFGQRRVYVQVIREIRPYPPGSRPTLVPYAMPPIPFGGAPYRDGDKLISPQVFNNPDEGFELKTGEDTVKESRIEKNYPALIKIRLQVIAQTPQGDVPVVLESQIGGRNMELSKKYQ